MSPSASPSAYSPLLSWVITRFQNANTSGVHFEASLYGPLLSILHGIFPSNRQFMIKPQGILRREYNARLPSDQGSHGSGGDLSDFEPPDNDLDYDNAFNEIAPPDANQGPNAGIPDFLWAGDVSRDSSGGYVPSRALGRTPAGDVGYADFIIVKATEMVTDDHIISVIEVKKDDQEAIKGEYQLHFYSELSGTKNRDPQLRFFLIAGSQTQVWHFEDDTFDSPLVKIAEYETTSLDFRLDLYAVASDHWA